MYEYNKTKHNWKASLKFQNVVQRASCTNTTASNNTPLEKVVETLKNNAHNSHLLLQRILFILKLYPATRTQPQIETLRSYFESKFPYISTFKDNLNEETYLTLFREMALESIEQHMIVCNYGDIGRKMYCILEGSVAILIPYDEFRSYNTKIINPNIPFQQILDTHFNEFHLTATKTAGEHFGEIAIEQKCPRTASVLTTAPCEVAVITHELFQKLLGQYKNILLEAKITFLSQLPLFRNWQRKHQILLLNSAEEITLQSKNIIYTKNQEDNSLYLIVEGEIELSNWVIQQHHQIRGNPLSEISSLLPSRIQQKKLLALYASGQLFGDLEFRTHKMTKVTRTTEAKAKSETRLFKIKYQTIMEYFKMFSTQDEILNYFKYKKEYHEVQQEEIPQPQSPTYQIDYQAIKNQYYDQNDDIVQLQVNKYSFAVPFRAHPLNKEAALIRSERQATTHQIHKKQETLTKDKFTPFTSSVFSILQGEHKKTNSLDMPTTTTNTPKGRPGRILSSLFITKKCISKEHSPSKNIFKNMFVSSEYLQLCHQFPQ